MDWKAVLDLAVTAVFLLGVALALWCLVTIHRSPYFSEVQKLKWLLLVLFLPYLGPLAWILRVRTERREHAERLDTERADAGRVSTKREGVE